MTSAPSSFARPDTRAAHTRGTWRPKGRFAIAACGKTCSAAAGWRETAHMHTANITQPTDWYARGPSQPRSSVVLVSAKPVRKVRPAVIA
jgi:hypothetical protein